MRFNKQIAVILVLSSLLISAIGAALFLYYENENTKKENAQQLTVYIAKKDIKKHALVKESDVVKTVIAKRYLLSKPLLKKEIVNKFAKSSIYKNEMFRKEKLASKIGETEAKILPFKFNSYNASFKLFENPNYSLLKGDILNIVSVYPKSKDKKNMNYNVKYVAKQINVLGFLEKGKVVEKGFRKIKKKVKSKSKKNTKPKYELVKVFANEVVLDISDKTILSMIDDYNKGKQLWMVKTNQVIVAPKKEMKPTIIVSKTNVKIVKKTAKKRAKRVYPYKMYIPKNVTQTRTAIIEYEDSSIPEVLQQAVIKTDLQKQCMEQNNVLIGISRKVYLRSIPQLNGRIKKIVYRNYILPYKRKVDANWYEICDGKFVHKNEAMKIDYKEAQGLLHGSKKTKK